MRGQPRVTGQYGGDPVKLVRDAATGQILMKAGGGRWMLPGSNDEIRVHNGRLWLFSDGEPMRMLATGGGGGGGGGAALPDGSEKGVPLVWNGVAWMPAQTLNVPMAAIGKLLSNDLQIGEEVAITEKGIYLPGNRLLGWHVLDRLSKLDLDKPHGLPMQEVDGVLRVEVPIEAPNLRDYAWRSELERLETRVSRLVPEVSVPKNGSIVFDVDRDGTLSILVKQGGRRYRARVPLQEV